MRCNLTSNIILILLLATFPTSAQDTTAAKVDADGAVGWMPAIPLSEGHESGNTGDTTIDLVWITLK